MGVVQVSEPYNAGTVAGFTRLYRKQAKVR